MRTPTQNPKTTNLNLMGEQKTDEDYSSQNAVAIEPIALTRDQRRRLITENVDEHMKRVWERNRALHKVDSAAQTINAFVKKSALLKQINWFMVLLCYKDVLSTATYPNNPTAGQEAAMVFNYLGSAFVLLHTLKGTTGRYVGAADASIQALEQKDVISKENYRAIHKSYAAYIKSVCVALQFGFAILAGLRAAEKDVDGVVKYIGGIIAARVFQSGLNFMIQVRTAHLIHLERFKFMDTPWPKSFKNTSLASGAALVIAVLTALSSNIRSNDEGNLTLAGWLFRSSLSLGFYGFSTAADVLAENVLTRSLSTRFTGDVKLALTKSLLFGSTLLRKAFVDDAHQILFLLCIAAASFATKAGDEIPAPLTVFFIYAAAGFAQVTLNSITKFNQLTAEAILDLTPQTWRPYKGTDDVSSRAHRDDQLRHTADGLAPITIEDEDANDKPGDHAIAIGNADHDEPDDHTNQKENTDPGCLKRWGSHLFNQLTGGRNLHSNYRKITAEDDIPQLGEQDYQLGEEGAAPKAPSS